MKSFSNLNFGENEVLKKEQLKSVMGGFGPSATDTFQCYCGFTGGSYESMTFDVEANNINGALDVAGQGCGGLGATCGLKPEGAIV